MCFALAVQSITAQDTPNSYTVLAQHPQNGVPEFVRINTYLGTHEFVDWFKTNFSLHSSSQLVVADSNRDAGGNLHIKYKQYYNNILVHNSSVHLHCKGSQPHSFYAVYYPHLWADTTGLMSETLALELALQQFPQHSIFSWQKRPPSDSILTNEYLNYPTTLPPQCQKLIVADQRSALRPSLVYQFKVLAIAPLNYKEFLINAQNGRIIHTEELIQEVDKNGTAYTKYYGHQAIVCDSLAPNLYKLKETRRGLDSICVLNQKATDDENFYDEDTIWNNFNAKKDEVAGDVMWGIEKTYDYFKEKYGRNSFDNKGHCITGYVHGSFNNAYWLNGGVGIAVFGDGDNKEYNPWTSVDIVAHEITHGITSATAQLIYNHESGALSESFSDIFAKCVEKYAFPDSFSWSIGKAYLLNGTAPIRMMNSPNEVLHPKFYKGKYFDLTNPDDHYGIHTNSGVQNYWFYLLSEGGTGLRESDARSYFVHKIGMDTAAMIAFSTLTHYLTEYSGFSDAARYSIAASELMFGEDSWIVHQVKSA